MTHDVPRVSGFPVLDVDLFSDEVIHDPYPHYRTLRDLGPVVHLAAQDHPAVGRHDDVRAVLGDPEVFVSGQGVLWNDVANRLTTGTTLASDPPEHGHLRRLVAGRLTPRRLRGERDGIERKAAVIVDRVLQEAGVIDAVVALAQAMPMSVVPDFVGFPNDCRPHLLPWAKGAVEAGAPFSSRTPAAIPMAEALGHYTEQLVAQRAPLPGSLGADLLAAADRGDLPMDRCPALMLDYFGPSMETTLTAIGNAIALFARHPDQWDLLRADPGLVAGAFNETVRLESPLRAFTRVAARDSNIGGTAVAAGTRLGVFYASANRDERKWRDPDTFDIARRNADHLGLGYGEHACAGQGLARLEFASLMTCLARSVRRIEPAGEFPISISGLVRSRSALPVRLVPA